MPWALLPAACRECEKAQVALRNEALQVCGNDIPPAKGEEMVLTRLPVSLFLTKSVVGFNEWGSLFPTDEHPAVSFPFCFAMSTLRDLGKLQRAFGVLFKV